MSGFKPADHEPSGVTPNVRARHAKGAKGGAMAPPSIDVGALPGIVTAYLGDAAPAIDDRDVDTIFAIAHTFFAREQFVRAANLFRLLVLFRPTEARSWLSLAACHDALGDEARALVLFRVAAAAPGRPDDRLRAHLYLARKFLQLGQTDDAEVHVTSVVSLGAHLGADQRELEGEVRDVLRAYERAYERSAR